MSSWLSFDTTALPPGSAIVVPRDLEPFDLRQTIIDVSSIMSQIAVTVASLAVLAHEQITACAPVRCRQAERP